MSRSRSRRQCARRSRGAALLALTAAGAHALTVRAIVAQEAAPASGARCEAPIGGVETRCAMLRVPAGYAVRTIRTQPSDAPPRRLPALLFVQWLSCDPVAIPDSQPDGWALMLADMARRSGAIMMRTEKTGIGGSGGPACATLGYDDELALHRASLAALRRDPAVDTTRIVLVGGSMGGTMVPLLAADAPGLAGIVVWGTTTLTWGEHLVRLDRRVLEGRVTRSRPAQAPAQVAGVMPMQLRWHAQWLAPGAEPHALAARDTALAAAWARQLGVDTAARTLYGRSTRFHQEAAAQPWERAWREVAARGVRVAVLRGACDALMDREEHERIRDIVQGVSPALATFDEVPATTHGLLASDGCEARRDATTWSPPRYDGRATAALLARVAAMLAPAPRR
ncbi:MAG: hypothetical protein MUF21_06805 [Gemmatimonadaceae bacterium]|nr:hypothetical protein [Gemmatimonadaceae bacterium]